MIAHLSGRLREKSPEYVVVDVGGVGFQVFVSLQTLTALPEEGAPIELHTCTVVREDALQLFGFRAAAERRLFLLLQSVSGIGPRLALNVLSGLAAADLVEALRGGNLARLVGVPGIGKKTAERMILELRDKALALPDERRPASAAPAFAEQAVSALMNLDYRRQDAERAVEAAIALGKATFEEVVREALRGLVR